MKARLAKWKETLTSPTIDNYARALAKYKDFRRKTGESVAVSPDGVFQFLRDCVRHRTSYAQMQMYLTGLQKVYQEEDSARGRNGATLRTLDIKELMTAHEGVTLKWEPGTLEDTDEMDMVGRKQEKHSKVAELWMGVASGRWDAHLRCSPYVANTGPNSSCHTPLLPGEWTCGISSLPISFQLPFGASDRMRTRRLCFNASNGKRDLDGNIKIIGALRNKDPLLCATGALAVQLVVRYDIRKKPQPDFSSKTNWYSDKVVGVRESNQRVYLPDS